VAHTDNGDTVLYDNPCPYNPHSCRPIRLAFKPENSDLSFQYNAKSGILKKQFVSFLLKIDLVLIYFLQ